MKSNKIRKCPRCGVVETIEVIKMKTINNKKVRCLSVECDECGYVFDLLPEKR
jgi:uncharacterized Zn finger protein